MGVDVVADSRHNGAECADTDVAFGRFNHQPDDDYIQLGYFIGQPVRCCQLYHADVNSSRFQWYGIFVGDGEHVSGYGDSLFEQMVLDIKSIR